MMWPVRLLVVAWLALGSAGIDARALVQGRITARDGTPVAGAYVEPRSLDRPRARIPDVGNVSGADGRYEWTLPAGAYEISVSAEGYRRLTRRVTVHAGQTATLDFTLTRPR